MLNHPIAQKRLLILGAVLIATGIGTPVGAILLGGPDPQVRRPAATPTTGDWLDPAAEPELFAEDGAPPAGATTGPPVTTRAARGDRVRGDRGRDDQVAPGSGSRPLPETTTTTTAPADPADPAGSTPATPQPAEETVAPKPAQTTPPVILPVPLPGPEETGAPPPPPLPED